MTRLIEGMAKKLAEVNSSPFGRVRWQDFVLDAQAAYAFLADPNNITDEMVEAAIQASAKSYIEHVKSGATDDHAASERAMKAALTAALTAASGCAHEWTDARNEVVESGEICLKCNAIRRSQAATIEEK